MAATLEPIAAWDADSVKSLRRALGLPELAPALCADVALILQDLREGLRQMPVRPWFAPVVRWKEAADVQQP
ncbi:hypothetical protein QTH90_30315 [Variovorax sp. J2P1-59]|uniref:hypothetical protein n=1 Tax=Variovorax flavidus TaxID=3053501 RepID=UPI00257580B6|nr:hypothetical protein [Variovorax sp. J2P1-59]MDM0078735.1 hypothetical protein [Variovorax sp. J2P1-59]